VLGACGGNGDKFSFRIRQFMDSIKGLGFEASLMVEAIRLHVKECVKKPGSALKEWT
jgi:hypothetical protein